MILIIWNSLSPWPDSRWINWFFISGIVITGIVAVVMTVWFTTGGIIDLRRLFRRLKDKEDDVLDDGRVVGHRNADEVEPADRDDAEMHTLRLSFELTEPESIEPRVTAGDSRLWLHKVVFDQLDTAGP